MLLLLLFPLRTTVCILYSDGNIYRRTNWCRVIGNQDKRNKKGEMRAYLSNFSGFQTRAREQSDLIDKNRRMKKNERGRQNRIRDVKFMCEFVGLHAPFSFPSHSMKLFSLQTLIIIRLSWPSANGFEWFSLVCFVFISFIFFHVCAK